QEQLGNKDYENTRYTYTVSGGLKGRVANRFDWEAFYQYGRRTQSYQIRNTRIEGRFFEAMDALIDPITGVPACRSAEAAAAGCLPVDLFAPGPVPEEVKEYFQYDHSRDVTNEQNLVGFSIAGELM